MQSHHATVTLIGAGFAGLILAIALARAGQSVALIEAKSFAQKKTTQAQDGRALALSIKSKKILDDLDIWSAVAIKAQTLTQVQISQQGSWGRARLTAAQQGVDALGFVIPAHELGEGLLALAQAQENITWFCPASVARITQDASGAQVVLQDNGGVIHSALVMVADGMHSGLAQQLGFSQTTRDYQQQAIVANVSSDRACAGTAYQRLTAQGTLALLPLTDKRFTWVMSVAQDTLAQWQALTDEAWLAKLQDLWGFKVGRLHDLSPRQTYPLHAVFVEQAYQGRVLLMGNAAHTLNPVAAQGLNLTLRDIDVLIKLFKQTDDWNENLLADYQAKRSRDQKNMLQLTDNLVDIFNLPYAKFARSLGLFALDNIPFMKQRLFNHLLGAR